jgi:hypothetical protein
MMYFLNFFIIVIFSGFWVYYLDTMFVRYSYLPILNILIRNRVPTLVVFFFFLIFSVLSLTLSLRKTNDNRRKRLDIYQQ